MLRKENIKLGAIEVAPEPPGVPPDAPPSMALMTKEERSKYLASMREVNDDATAEEHTPQREQARSSWKKEAKHATEKSQGLNMRRMLKSKQHEHQRDHTELEHLKALRESDTSEDSDLEDHVSYVKKAIRTQDASLMQAAIEKASWGGIRQRQARIAAGMDRLSSYEKVQFLTHLSADDLPRALVACKPIDRTVFLDQLEEEEREVVHLAFFLRLGVSEQQAYLAQQSVHEMNRTKAALHSGWVSA